MPGVTAKSSMLLTVDWLRPTYTSRCSITTLSPTLTLSWLRAVKCSFGLTWRSNKQLFDIGRSQNLHHQIRIVGDNSRSFSVAYSYSVTYNFLDLQIKIPYMIFVVPNIKWFVCSLLHQLFSKDTYDLKYKKKLVLSLCLWIFWIKYYGFKNRFHLKRY